MEKYEVGDLVYIAIMKLRAIVVRPLDERGRLVLYSYYNNGCTLAGPFDEPYIELLSKDTKTKKKLNGREVTNELLRNLTFEIEQDCKNP